MAHVVFYRKACDTILRGELKCCGLQSNGEQILTGKELAQCHVVYETAQLLENLGQVELGHTQRRLRLPCHMYRLLTVLFGTMSQRSLGETSPVLSFL